MKNNYRDLLTHCEPYKLNFIKAHFPHFQNISHYHLDVSNELKQWQVRINLKIFHRYESPILSHSTRNAHIFSYGVEAKESLLLLSLLLLSLLLLISFHSLSLERLIKHQHIILQLNP